MAVRSIALQLLSNIIDRFDEALPRYSPALNISIPDYLPRFLMLLISRDKNVTPIVVANPYGNYNVSADYGWYFNQGGHRMCPPLPWVKT